MTDSKPETVLRSDYRVPDYLIDTVDLSFDLREEGTRVESRLGLRRRSDAADERAPLVLVGESVALEEIEIDGRPLAESEYRIEGEELIVPSPPSRFELRTVVTIHPETNTELSGLYKSSGNFCTQCEEMGFRRITYFLDRPDVMARYSVAIEAD
nr:aminopeptidase N [Pseudomonadota bacterium]